MSYKKRKNKAFDKKKPPIRKDALMMRIDAISECVLDLKAWMKKNGKGVTPFEADKAYKECIDIYWEFLDIENELEDIALLGEDWT